MKRSGGSGHAYDTFFFEQLLILYDSVGQWTRQTDIFSKKMLLIPMHSSNHWSLCVVILKSKCIIYYDSLGGTSLPYMDIILQYLAYEMNQTKHKELFLSEWRKVNAKNIPQQNNFSDCGVFLCSYAECLTRNVSFDFTSNDIPQIRARMLQEILTSQLSSRLLPLDSRKAGSQRRIPPKPISSLKQKKTAVSRAKVAEPTKDSVTDLRDVFLHVAASFHQVDRRFPQGRANAQCTAISTFWIAIMAQSTESVSQNLLDTILIDGDRYYVECKSRNDVQVDQLHVEDLCTRFTVFNRLVNIDQYHRSMW
ncbi:sentrin-specific protease 1 [Diachasma alloeum]|uniref:sentrin-specific protease 1 n=1 Tax=Diachasma alloeum TaxID=454923 RepID=UPI0007384DB3|nr:sentrin-specific protease 1 [Diachasma alloeum]XP_015118554.1 sentrin-specific protease 1 [Diachasma alloeum]XP_015118555.1 sentrin-specific protease 1 [Diachasma alloeum]